MIKPTMTGKRFQCHPLTEARWGDFEQLFGKNGACGGCWCMLWRLSRKQFDSQKGDGNRKAMMALVASGEVPGLLDYFDGRPVGWCAVAPRAHYPALGRSRVLKPVDDQPCWSVSCLFVHREYRNKGVSTQLLRATIDYVNGQGVRILEGYPVEPKSDKPIPPAFAWTEFQRHLNRRVFRKWLVVHQRAQLCDLISVIVPTANKSLVRRALRVAAQLTR